MKLSTLLIPLIVGVLSFPAFAFSTNEERIDSYLQILDTASAGAKHTMLQELRSSGLSDPRLFDVIEQRLLSKLNNGKIDKADIETMNYEMRALGYSGNTKYLATLEDIKSNRDARSLHRHAKKAMRDMESFKVWNQLIAQSKPSVEGKSAEIATYMKMLNTDNMFVQRLAAQTMYNERTRDKDLLALTANKLEGLYMRENLSKGEQDTAAWLCKALGQSGVSEHLSLLAKVTAETPYPKIKKYSSKY